MSLRMAKPKLQPRSDRTRRTAAARQVEAVLPERNVQVGRERWGTDWPAVRPLQTDRVAVPVGIGRLELARRWSAFTPLSLMFKSKSMPIRSKKLSLSVMKRTSIVTCRSCRRRSCCSRSAICFVDFLRLADDQAEVGGERTDFGLAAAVLVPRVGRDGRGDQVDERIEVGVRPAAHAARAGADRHRRRAARRWTRGLRAESAARERCRSADGRAVAPRSLTSTVGPRCRRRTSRGRAGGGHRVVDQSLQAHVAARHEVRNRRHQVGDVVGLRIDLAVAQLLAGDLEHFVLDRRSSSGAARGSGSARS